MGRFLILIAFVLLLILLVGVIINSRVKKILRYNGIKVYSSVITGIVNDINFYKLIKQQTDEEKKKRYSNLFTIDMFVQILFILLTIVFMVVLANSFFRS